MTTAVIRRGVRDGRRSALAWGATLGLFSALIALAYPSIEVSLQRAVESYPAALKEAFGIGELDTVEAYMHAEMFSLIVPLAVAYLAARHVSHAISGAEERGHLDVLLAAPLMRESLTWSAFAGAAVVSTGVLIVLGLLTLAGSATAGDAVSVSAAASALLAAWGLALFAAGLAALASGALHREAQVLALTMGVLVAMYLADVVSRLAEGVEPLRHASAFRYYGAAMREGLDVTGLVVLVGAALALAAAGAQLFARRDIHG